MPLPLVNDLQLLPQQARNMLADVGALPEEFAQPDQTEGGSVDDTGAVDAD